MPLSRRALGTCLALSLLTFSAFGAEPVVHLSADSWMPYNGEPDAAKPGYVVEFAREIFAEQGIKVEYVTMPWADTLAATRAGTIDGALCANREEGAGLVFGDEPVGAPKMIVVTRPDVTWTYRNPASFRELKLGVIAEYSYWPALDAYLEHDNGDRVFVARGDAPLDALLAKLDAGEIDVFVESEAVFAWKLRELDRSRATIKVVYRHTPDEVFVAFAPTAQGQQFSRIFSAGLKKLKADGRADKIAKAYGLLSWQ